MIIYKYIEGWDSALLRPNPSPEQGQQNCAEEFHACDHLLSWHDFVSPSKNTLNKIKQKKIPLEINSDGLNNNTPRLAQHILQVILTNFDEDDCITGLFRALSQAKNRVSPFLATHSFCIKVHQFSISGCIHFNISPIYHLGPEYPDQYKQQHGTELDESAIIGLIQNKEKDLHYSLNRTFALGIDAGILFQASKTSHNKIMSLDLHPNDEGIMAILNCENQTTSRKFSWEVLGFEA